MQYPRMYYTGMLGMLIGMGMACWSGSMFLGIAQHFFGVEEKHSAEFIVTTMIASFPVMFLGMIIVHQRDDFIMNTDYTKLSLAIIFCMNFGRNVSFLFIAFLVSWKWIADHPENVRVFLTENKNGIILVAVTIWLFFKWIWKK